MRTPFATAIAIVSLSLWPAASAAATASTCPDAVKAAVDKAYAKATIEKCKQEKEDGKLQYEVKITTAEKQRLELDVSPEGTILQTEQVVKLDAVPAAVTKAFAAKYPKAKATRAEKQVHADGKVFYELAWKADKTKKEATFAQDGTFVEEE